MSKTVTIQEAKERQPKYATLKSVPSQPQTAVAFSKLKEASKTEKWDLFDTTHIHPIVEAFMAKASKPLTIIKDVREQDMTLAEDLLSMSSYANVAKGEFCYQNDTCLYDLVIFELATHLHEKTIGFVTDDISMFLRGQQWMYGYHKLIEQDRNANSVDNKSPDESFSLTPHTYKSVPLLFVEVAFAQKLEDVLCCFWWSGEDR